MKQIGLWILIFGLTFIGCHQSTTTKENQNKINAPAEVQVDSTNDKNGAQSEISVLGEIHAYDTIDKDEIQTLIRQVLNWANSKNSIDLIPAIADSKDSFFIGFDMDKHKQNLIKLKATNFFATEFINNYDQIILTLDRKLRNGEYGQWSTGDQPSFIFASDVDPWTHNQDVPYDKPNPLDYIEVQVVQLDQNKGELDWKWGNLPLNLYTDTGWKDFKYRFRVVKEDGKWKIAYLWGFDFKEGTR